MGASRSEAILRSFWELRCERLSVVGRGLLWTLLALGEGSFRGETLVYLAGPRWRLDAVELERMGVGRLVEVVRGGDVWRFDRFPVVEDRLRERELERRRRVRGQNGKDTEE